MKPPQKILALKGDEPPWFLRNIWQNLLLDWSWIWGTQAAYIQASAFNSAVQSIANGTLVALTFDSEDYNDGKIHSTTVNTSRFTVPTGQNGLYLANSNLQFAANAAGVRTLIIRKNGTTTVGGTNEINPGAGAAAAIPCTTVVKLVAGDYVEFIAFQNSGGALNTVAGSGVTFGQLVRLR